MTGWDFLNSLAQDKPELLAVVAVATLAATVLTAFILSTNWRRVRQAALAASLKAHMLDLGMEAADIERVVRATPGGRAIEPRGAEVSVGETESVETQIVKQMTERGYDGDGVASVLQALSPWSSRRVGESKVRRARELEIVGTLVNRREPAQSIARILEASCHSAQGRTPIAVVGVAFAKCARSVMSAVVVAADAARDALVFAARMVWTRVEASWLDARGRTSITVAGVAFAKCVRSAMSAVVVAAGAAKDALLFVVQVMRTSVGRALSTWRRGRPANYGL
jgi:hypothetical protein